MKIQSLQIIASWLLLSAAMLSLFPLPSSMLMSFFIASIAIALIAFFPWKTSYPWLIFCFLLLILSFFDIRGDERTKLITLITTCAIGLAIANQLYFHASIKQIGKRHNQTDNPQKTK